MKTTVIVLGGVLLLGLIAGGTYVAQRPAQDRASTHTASVKSPSQDRQRASERRLAQLVERQEEANSPSEDVDAVPSPASNDDASDLVLTDVAALGVSAWVGDQYELAFQYEGPRLSAEELAKKQGRYTEATVTERENELLAALPEMQAQVEEMRKLRAAESERLARTQLTPEEQAARDGIELEF